MPEKYIQKLLTTALMASSFAGLLFLGWLAYDERQGSSGEIPLIAAETKPFKIKPKDTGGMVIPNRDKIIYNAISERESVIDATIAKLLPPPEKPIDRADIPAPVEYEHADKPTPWKVVTLSEIPDKPERKRKPITNKDEHWVQLGSYRNRESAERGFRIIKKRFPALIASGHRIKIVNLGNKGVYYRLQIGSLNSTGEAGKICKKFKEKKQGCFLAK